MHAVLHCTKAQTHTHTRIVSVWNMKAILLLSLLNTSNDFRHKNAAAATEAEPSETMSETSLSRRQDESRILSNTHTHTNNEHHQQHSFSYPSHNSPSPAEPMLYVYLYYHSAFWLADEQWITSRSAEISEGETLQAAGLIQISLDFLVNWYLEWSLWMGCLKIWFLFWKMYAN